MDLKEIGCACVDLIQVAQYNVRCCEHDNERSGYVKGEKCLDSMSEYQLLKKNASPQRQLLAVFTVILKAVILDSFPDISSVLCYVSLVSMLSACFRSLRVAHIGPYTDCLSNVQIETCNCSETRKRKRP
jgi:uncharacterized membrane protein YwzB